MSIFDRTDVIISIDSHYLYIYNDATLLEVINFNSIIKCLVEHNKDNIFLRICYLSEINKDEFKLQIISIENCDNNDYNNWIKKCIKYNVSNKIIYIIYKDDMNIKYIREAKNILNTFNFKNIYMLSSSYLILFYSLVNSNNDIIIYGDKKFHNRILNIPGMFRNDINYAFADKSNIIIKLFNCFKQKIREVNYIEYDNSYNQKIISIYDINIGLNTEDNQIKSFVKKIISENKYNYVISILNLNCNNEYTLCKTLYYKNSHGGKITIKDNKLFCVFHENRSNKGFLEEMFENKQHYFSNKINYKNENLPVFNKYGYSYYYATSVTITPHESELFVDGNNMNSVLSRIKISDNKIKIY